MGFRVKGAGFWILGFGVEELGGWVRSVGFEVQGLWFRIWVDAEREEIRLVILMDATR